MLGWVFFGLRGDGGFWGNGFCDGGAFLSVQILGKAERSGRATLHGALHRFLVEVVRQGLVASAHDISDGGLAVTGHEGIL